MSVYKDMAHDAGYRGEEAEQLAQAIEQDHMRQAMEHQEQEPDQIDMMSVDELRTALRSASSEGALKDKALRNARAALDTLPAEALGTAERDGIQWYLRDELVSEIVKALVSEEREPCPECGGPYKHSGNPPGCGE